MEKVLYPSECFTFLMYSDLILLRIVELQRKKERGRDLQILKLLSPREELILLECDFFFRTICLNIPNASVSLDQLWILLRSSIIEFAKM